MAKIMVTGGLGYIGYDLVKNLLLDDINEVTIYDNLYQKNLAILFHKKLKDKRVRFVEGDILDDRMLKKESAGMDSIIHLAAKVGTPFGKDDFQMYDYVNNWGTANVVNAVLENNISELIYLSSLSVFGNSNTIVDYSSSINPPSGYPQSKYNGEQQLMVLANKCKTIIVRSANTYGYNPSIRLDTVINNFVYKSKLGQKLLIHGNAQEFRGFIAIDRLTEQISTLVLNDNFSKPIYHLCDDSKKIVDIVHLIQSINPNTEYRHVNPDRKMTSQEFIPSSLSEKEDQRTSFEDNVKNLYNAFTVN